MVLELKVLPRDGLGWRYDSSEGDACIGPVSLLARTTSARRVTSEDVEAFGGLDRREVTITERVMPEAKDRNSKITRRRLFDG